MSPPAAPASQPVLPDEILVNIFLRLDSLADLARASAACTAYRRVITGRSFRSLHPPPVLGFLEFDAPGEFHPVEPPHRYTPAARGLAQIADFTFSFLPAGDPNPNDWHVCDARDGRVLLYRLSWLTDAFPDLVVCDPLHRRYVQLPPIPGGRYVGYKKEFDLFLDPATDREKEEEQDLPFRVICAVHSQHELVTFHFSSVTREWRRITFDRSPPLDPATVDFQLFQRQYTHNCFYWRFFGMGRLDILDTREMKLSTLDQLPGGNASPFFR